MEKVTKQKRVQSKTYTGTRKIWADLRTKKMKIKNLEPAKR